jgi:hypothetical protein
MVNRSKKETENIYIPKPNVRSELAEEFQLLGYDCVNESGVVLFFVQDMGELDEIRHQIRRSGYKGSWGIRKKSEEGSNADKVG